MTSVALSRRVEKVVGYPPLSELSDLERREFKNALLEAAALDDLSGQWQAAILEAEQNRSKLRLVKGAKWRADCESCDPHGDHPLGAA